MNSLFAKTSLAALAAFGFAACSDSNNSTTPSSSTVSSGTSVSSGASADEALPPIPVDFIMDSALNGNVEAIALAIEAGIDPNVIGDQNRTPLMLAAFNGHLEIVERLLEAGARVDLKDTTNRTALMFACTGPNTKMVSLLLRRGADINGIDNHESWTPLMFAAAEGHKEVVQLLLDSNANPNAQDVDGETAAQFAHSRGFPEVAAMIEARMQ